MRTGLGIEDIQADQSIWIGIVIDCCEVVARVTQSRVRVVISCVVSQDNILLVLVLLSFCLRWSNELCWRRNPHLGSIVPGRRRHLQLVLIVICVNEVGVYIQPGWADAPWATVGVGQAQIC